MVSIGLNRAYGSSLRRAISNSTDNRFKAFFVGILTAALLQSSTAANIIVSNFAARNIITVAGALAVVLGADVGTTLAAQFMSLDLAWFVPVLLIIGFTVNSRIQTSRYKHIGRALIGLALILISLGMIKDVAVYLRESEILALMVEPLSNQPILAIALAGIFTWIAHSSLGSVLLFMSFAATGAIPVDLGFSLVLGANVGGAIAPVVMTIRDIPAGRRIPLGNLMTRGIGVLICLPFLGVIAPYIAMIDPDPARQIVNFHTAFNLVLALSFLPFIKPLTQLSTLILPDAPREEDASLPQYLDPSAIEGSPSVALAGVARETLRVSDIVLRMMRDIPEAFRTNDAMMVQEIRDQEVIVDSLYESIKNYLARLSAHILTPEEEQRYIQILTFSTNLEHIGDIIDKSLMELASKKIRNQDHFSTQGFKEISTLHARVMDSISLAQNLFMTKDPNMARKLLGIKAAMRSQEMTASENHFKRLSEGVAATIATSSLHLDILRDLRRINSYISLIAYEILQEEENDENKSVERGSQKKEVDTALKTVATREALSAPDDEEDGGVVQGC